MQQNIEKDSLSGIEDGKISEKYKISLADEHFFILLYCDRRIHSYTCKSPHRNYVAFYKNIIIITLHPIYLYTRLYNIYMEQVTI